MHRKLFHYLAIVLAIFRWLRSETVQMDVAHTGIQTKWALFERVPAGLKWSNHFLPDRSYTYLGHDKFKPIMDRKRERKESGERDKGEGREWRNGSSGEERREEGAGERGRKGEEVRVRGEEWKVKEECGSSREKEAKKRGEMGVCRSMIRRRSLQLYK